VATNPDFTVVVTAYVGSLYVGSVTVSLIRFPNATQVHVFDTQKEAEDFLKSFV